MNIRKSGSCMLYAEKVNNALIAKGIKDYVVVEGYVQFKELVGSGISSKLQHTWIQFNNGKKIDKTLVQFEKFGFDMKSVKYFIKKKYSPQEYSELCKEHPV